MKKKVKKNVIYLNLDDLQKLYGISPKLLKKLKKKRKKRKSQKGIKFEKIKDSSQMPGVQYFNNNSNMDTQLLKDQIKKLVQPCDYLEAFILTHGLTGGTGSGVTARLMEKLTEKAMRVNTR